MHPAFATWYSSKPSEKLQFTSARIPRDSITLQVVLKRVMLPKAGSSRPYKLIVYPMQQATVKHDSEKKKKVDSDATEPIELPAGKVAIFVAYYPSKCILPHGASPAPLPLVTGASYLLKGFTYERYLDRVSFACTMVEPWVVNVADVPFPNRSISLQRDCCRANESNYQVEDVESAFVAIAIGDDTQREAPFTVGRITFSDLDRPDYLERPMRGDQTKMEIALGKEKPAVEVLQVTPEGANERYAVRFGAYASDFACLHLSLEQWKALAKVFFPVMKGWLLGTVNRQTTAGMKAPECYDGVLDLDANLVLDVPWMLERAGVEVDAAGMEQLLGAPSSLNSEEWKDSPMSHHVSATALNLTQVTGDASEHIGAVAAGTHKCYVVSREMAIPDKLKKLRELPINQRATAMEEDQNMAIYVVGKNVRGMLKPAQKMAKRG
jgi:hypothetical protein